METERMNFVKIVLVLKKKISKILNYLFFILLVVFDVESGKIFYTQVPNLWGSLKKNCSNFYLDIIALIVYH